MHKVVASCIAMRGEVDAIAARLEKFRKVVSAAEEQLKNDKQYIRTDALRSPQRQRLVFLMRVFRISVTDPSRLAAVRKYGRADGDDRVSG